MPSRHALEQHRGVVPMGGRADESPGSRRACVGHLDVDKIIHTHGQSHFSLRRLREPRRGSPKSIVGRGAHGRIHALRTSVTPPLIAIMFQVMLSPARVTQWPSARRSTAYHKSLPKHAYMR